MADILLELKDITKQFDDTLVLKGINLQVERGEFITLLGPSGCGKTTTIRIIAGLEEPTSGQVFLEGKDVTNTEPNKRDVNTVFQNYALFPHMTVGENIAYSQKIRKKSKSDIARGVQDALELVQLEGYENRLPSQLSGGQKQRVAIARAVINEPKVLLLDEPLGALDLQLRHQMQVELKHLQKKLGITFIYITHDQEEALNMSSRVVVMKEGLFEQIGTPIDIYNKPKTSYVAQFVGSANLLHGEIIEKTDKDIIFQNKNGRGKVRLNGRRPEGKDITVAVRGEDVTLETEPQKDMACFSAIVKEKNFTGGSLHVVLTLEDGTEIVSFHHGIDCPVKIGERVCATWDPDRAVLVDAEETDEK